MSETNTQSQNLTLISILHYVLAAMIYLKGLFFLAMMGIGTLAVFGILSDKPHDMEEGLIAIGIIFFLLPVILLCITATIGTLVLLAGRRIGQRTNLTFCLIIAGLECLCMPFGTALGIFTLIQLTKDAVRENFQS